MLRRADELTPESTVDADVCIAGAGAAGITIARGLSSSGLRVALLESGDFDPTPAQVELAGGRSVGIPYELRAHRLRYFGGATGHWHGWCRRLEPWDVDGPDGWPLPFSELERWYPRAQETVEIGTGWDAGEVAAAAGSALLPIDASRLRTVVYRYSPPTRFGTRYRADIVEHPQIDLVLGANVVDIELDARGEVGRLRCATLAGTRFEARARRYVLALGGIENARVLLASNRQREDGIANGSGRVGRFFCEHPHVRMGFAVTPAGPERSFYENRSPVVAADGRAVEVRGALALDPELRAREGLPRLSVTLNRASASRVHRKRLTGELTPLEVAAVLPGHARPDRVLALFARAEQTPLAESRVTLAPERDALGMPLARLDWRVDARDLAGIHRSLELVADELARIGLGRVWIRPEDEMLGDLRGGSHHMGTTRMSARPADGVVDVDGRAHECANLFIAGSSVFPRPGFANPTLTIVALAHRLAERIRSDLA